MSEMNWRGTSDTEWVERAGKRNWLVLSCNKRMLTIPDEVEAIYRWNAAIIYLTSGEEHSAQVLLAVLRHWREFEELWRTAPRPVVKFMGLRGPLKDRYRWFELPPRGTALVPGVGVPTS